VPRVSDRQLSLAIGAALFLAAAFPLLLVPVPPYQDLKAHLATVAIVSNPASYPEYVFNGFFKTNSTVVAFVWLFGKAIGIRAAGNLFVAIVLAANAFMLPSFVLHFGGRARMVVASLLAAPFVHNWFVSMGMLNFALSVPLAMLLLVALDRQRVAPSVARGAAVALLACLVWYAHQLPLMIVDLLAGVHVITQPGGWRARFDRAPSLLVPLAPATAIALIGGVTHMRGVVVNPAVTEPTYFQTVPWLVYDLWAHWGYGYTLLSVTSLVSMLVLAALAVRRARADVPFFGPWEALVLLLGYVLAPYGTVGLGYAGSRFIPFIWMAALVRVPERLPRWLAAISIASAALYFAGMAVDDVRLSREQAEVAAGLDAVPRGARMDVFLYSTRILSRNTWSLSNAWGDYVIDRGAHIAEVWADSPSLPIMWRSPPPLRLDPFRHRTFLDATATRDGFCAAHAVFGMGPAECDRQWRAEWAAYWRDVDPYVDTLLLWNPPQDALSQVPPSWGESFHQGRLWLFAKRGRVLASSSTVLPSVPITICAEVTFAPCWRPGSIRRIQSREAHRAHGQIERRRPPRRRFGRGVRVQPRAPAARRRRAVCRGERAGARGARRARAAASVAGARTAGVRSAVCRFGDTGISRCRRRIARASDVSASGRRRHSRAGRPAGSELRCVAHHRAGMGIRRLPARQSRPAAIVPR
jgi:hypothetical protein